MNDPLSQTPAASYRVIWIVPSRTSWSLAKEYEPENDLVLTFDFGLLRQIQETNGKVLLLDHLQDSGTMQENNFLVYNFFNKWHLDSDGADLFQHRGIPFGFAFRLDIWNDLVFYVRLLLSLSTLRQLEWKRVVSVEPSTLITLALNNLDLEHEVLGLGDRSPTGYFFPVFRWMDSRVRPKGLRQGLKKVVARGLSMASGVINWPSRNKLGVFIQEYHPTRSVLRTLDESGEYRISLMSYSTRLGFFKYLVEQPIPVSGPQKKHRRIALRLFHEFRLRKAGSLTLSNGIDATKAVYEIISQRIEPRIAEILATLESVERYLDRHPIQLAVLIANMGLVAVMVDLYCRKKGIPRFLVVNGMLGSSFLDEGKYADFINCYSSSMKESYFRGMTNIFPLGDPRMDRFANCKSRRPINRSNPRIAIGASGFNTTDLNSYVAVEYDFLFDVITALVTARDASAPPEIVIKVRPNGYREDYKRFIDEYFPGTPISIQDQVDMMSIYETADLYISIYSQTLIEASALGIPVIYYKKDTEIKDAPFDGHSELVTAADVGSLRSAVKDFFANSDRFDPFLRTDVLEKYIGPLDGGNLNRNVEFIRSLLEAKQVPQRYLDQRGGN